MNLLDSITLVQICIKEMKHELKMSDEQILLICKTVLEGDKNNDKSSK